MTRKILLIVYIGIVSSCSLKSQHNIVKIKGSDGIISVGRFFADSLFDGKVKYYDSLNHYLGYSTYEYGKKDGPEVSYFKDGRISDSSINHDDMRNGFAYKFNEKGLITYKSYYLNDRPFGHAYVYDSIGEITHYYFIDFEQKLIFEAFKVDSTAYAKGDDIQLNIYSQYSGENKTDFLFIYLFNPPYNKSHYEIGILDSTNKIISSKRIDSGNGYYESELEKLPHGEKYAIILHTYNPYKKRDDLQIKIINL